MKKLMHSPPFIGSLACLFLKRVSLTSPKYIGHHLILGVRSGMIIDQDIPIRDGRGFGVNLHKFKAVLRKYAVRDRVDLFSIAGAAEQHQVLSISADIRVVFAFGEHVLHQQNDTGIAMSSLGKQARQNRAVHRLMHQVVKHQDMVNLGVQFLQTLAPIGQPMLVFDLRSQVHLHDVVAGLPLIVKPGNSNLLVLGKVNQGVLEHLFHKIRLARLGGAHHQHGEGVLESKLGKKRMFGFSGLFPLFPQRFSSQFPGGLLQIRLSFLAV